MRVLRAPGFTLLLGGQAVNAIGNWVAVVAIWGFAAFRFDADVADLSMLFIVLSVPGALLGPLLGVPIDRLGPKRTLIIANTLGVVAALALTSADSYTDIILLAIPLGLIEGLATASLDALAPRLVEDDELVSANALLSSAQSVAIIVGPVVAAVVNARWGLAGAFLVDALTFVAGLVVVLPLDVDHVRGEPSTARRDLRDGLALVVSTPALRWTFGTASLTYLLWGLAGILEPLYVRDVLGESDAVFAVLQAVFGVGLVGAELALARIGDRIARPRFVALATVLGGATASLYLGSEWLWLAGVGVFLWGVDVAFFYAPAKTLLQRYTPMPAHGRVMSLNQTLEPLGSLVSTPVASVAVGVVGVRLTALGAGALIAGAGVVALRAARTLPEPTQPTDPVTAAAPDPVTVGPAPG